MAKIHTGQVTSAKSPLCEVPHTGLPTLNSMARTLWNETASLNFNDGVTKATNVRFEKVFKIRRVPKDAKRTSDKEATSDDRIRGHIEKSDKEQSSAHFYIQRFEKNKPHPDEQNNVSESGVTRHRKVFKIEKVAFDCGKSSSSEYSRGTSPCNKTIYFKIDRNARRRKIVPSNSKSETRKSAFTRCANPRIEKLLAQNIFYDKLTDAIINDLNSCSLSFGQLPGFLLAPQSSQSMSSELKLSLISKIKNNYEQSIPMFAPVARKTQQPM